VAQRPGSAQSTPNTRSKNEESADVDLHAAAELVLERDATRRKRNAARARRRQRQREKEQLAAVQRMRQSIEVMKWCMVSITIVMFLGILIAIWTLTSLNSELGKVHDEVEKARPQVERVITEVNEVVDQVQRVRETLNNPMQSIGSAFGRELDQKLQNYLNQRSQN
jgi:cell division protein FtsL